MHDSDEHHLHDDRAPSPRGPVAVIGSRRTGGTPSSATLPIEPATEGNSGRPSAGAGRSHPTLATAAAVCVVAASLSVVGWIHGSTRETVPHGGRYAVVESPPDTTGTLPSDIRTSPQPLVPMLPPDRATDRDPRTGSPPSKQAAAKPSNRAATSRPATPVVTGPAGVISGYAGRCLHAPGFEPADGTPIQMTACDGSPGERWTMASDGTIRTFGKCLTVADDQAADGTGIQLSTCRGAAGQQWRFTGGRDLVSPQADRCLDVKDFNTGDGALLQLWTCAGSANQKWSVPA
jgi:hypothetical protein